MEAIERARSLLAEALQRLSTEPEGAVEAGLRAVRLALDSIPSAGLGKGALAEALFRLRSLERALRASRARLRVAGPGAERERALADARADLEEALSLVEQLARELAAPEGAKRLES